jgi:hypothetical protein
VDAAGEGNAEVIAFAAAHSDFWEAIFGARVRGGIETERFH